MRVRSSLTPGMLIPLAIVAILVAFVAVGLRASSGLRAYVGGESLWTKSQKSGVTALVRYAITGQAADFDDYVSSRAIPDADRRARLELQRDDPDLDAATADFILGGNHPEDAVDMQWMFRTFSREQHLRRAVAIWTEADSMRDEVHERALALRALVEREASSGASAGAPAAAAPAAAVQSVAVRAVLDSISVLDRKLTALERDFSATLAEAGRWLHDTILVGAVVVGLLLAAFGAVSLSRLSREERRTHEIAQQRDAERLDSERALRERDEQLRQAQKMEAVGRLAGGVAHDFNNLLMVMRGNLEMATDNIGPDAAAAEDVREAMKAVDRAAALTTQLLTFSRQRAPELRVLRVHEVLGAAHGMLRRAVGDAIQLDIDVPSELPPVLGDAAQLEQVLLNLAVNARDAMPQGGTLRLRASRRFGLPSRVGSAAVVTDTPADWVVLEVTDSGDGIPAAIRERIFEPFFTTKAVGKGTGLGLATAYGIMAGLGGAIEVAAGESGGTTFTLWLPPTEAATAEERRAAVPPERREVQGRILLVEDQPEVRRLTSRILERAGFTIQETANGREALEVLARGSGLFDLVISDVVMPELGGRALAAALREQGTILPFVFISGYTPDLEPLLDPAGRPSEVLTKPFRAEDLLARVRRELGRA